MGSSNVGRAGEGVFRPVRFGLMIMALALLLAPLLRRRLPEAVEDGGLSFVQVVARNIREWDLDHDGWLEAGEVDRLMGDPRIVGADAAALATIKFRERELPESSKTGYSLWLHGLSKLALAGLTSLPSAIARLDDPFGCERRFRGFRLINAESPDRLFARGGPDFATLRQGRMADCFFFSVTGAIARRDPARIAAMIRPEADGSWTVHFPRGRARVPRLTQAEALVNNTGSTLADGYWVAVLQMAVGEVLRYYEDSGRRTADPTDAIAFGGFSSRVIEIFTGHHVRDFHFRQRRDEQRRLAETRRILRDVLGLGRVATVTMDATPAGPRKIPGLGYYHVYAALAYNPSDDSVTLWNPWGNDFDPQGPPGVEHGFVTRHGISRLPLVTLYRNFSSLQYETGDPVR